MAKQCAKYQMNICKQWEKKVRKTDILWNFLSPRAITQWKMNGLIPNSNLICNLDGKAMYQISNEYLQAVRKKVRKTDNLWYFLSPRAITQWNMNGLIPNSNLICNLVWLSNVPNIKWISVNREKKSAEKW